MAYTASAVQQTATSQRSHSMTTAQYATYTPKATSSRAKADLVFPVPLTASKYTKAGMVSRYEAQSTHTDGTDAPTSEGMSV